MSFGVFFGVNVGKTGDFYKGSCERWGCGVELLKMLK
jgi:hypothetical protein